MNKNSKPKISIGIPVYNGDKYLSLLLNTLLEQSYANFEIIISNNDSSDLTNKICLDYASRDDRIHYILQDKPIKAYDNYKVVLDNSNGKYFMWIAADDLLGDKNYLKHLNDNISDKYDYYITEVSIIDSEGLTIRSNIMQGFKDCITQFDFINESLLINSHQVYGLFLINKLKDDFKYLNECKNLSCYNEGLFVHAISAKRKGKFLPNAEKLYRRHENNWSSRVKATKLFVSFIMYSTKSIKYLISLKSFSTLEKIRLIRRKFSTDLPYIAYLALASIWQTFGLKKISFLKKLLGR